MASKKRTKNYKSKWYIFLMHVRHLDAILGMDTLVLSTLLCLVMQFLVICYFCVPLYLLDVCEENLVRGVREDTGFMAMLSSSCVCYCAIICKVWFSNNMPCHNKQDLVSIPGSGKIETSGSYPWISTDIDAECGCEWPHDLGNGWVHVDWCQQFCCF